MTALNYINFFSFLITIGVNYLTSAGIGPFKSLSNISNTYNTTITPPNWAFGIWGLIYTGLLCFSVGQLFPKLNLQTTVKNISFWFMLSCVANMTWLLMFSLGRKETIYTSLFVIIVLLVSLYVIQMKAKIFNNKHFSWSKLLLVDIPFSLYLGWIIFATFLNLAIVIKILMQNSNLNDYLLFIIFATMITAVYLSNLYFNDNYVTQLVYIYALMSLIIKYSLNNSFYSKYLIGILIFAALSLIVKIFLDNKLRKIEQNEKKNLYNPLV